MSRYKKTVSAIYQDTLQSKQKPRFGQTGSREERIDSWRFLDRIPRTDLGPFGAEFVVKRIGYLTLKFVAFPAGGL